MYERNSYGISEHKSTRDVVSFILLIILYFSSLVFADTFCQGNSPFKQVMNIYPNDMRSSLRLASIPLCIFKLA